MVKLADFGVGRSLDMLPHGAAKTRLVGTPLYFSPEMCEVPLPGRFAATCHAT